MSQDDYPATDEMEDILSILNDSDVLSESDKGDGRVFELIASLQASRTARTAGAAQGPDLEDEWENDDDNGYIAVGLTEEEFFEFENKCIADLLAAKETLLLSAEDHPPSSPSPASPVPVIPVPDHPLPSDPAPVPPAAELLDPVDLFPGEFLPLPTKRQSVGERRRSEVIGQHLLDCASGQGKHCYFNLKVIFEPFKTGFEESKDFVHPKGTVIAGRYEVYDVLGTAAFSTALQCIDLVADTENGESEWVCLKVIKNNKDFLDQSLDEIKLLQYINSGDTDKHCVLRLIDYFYTKEHLFIVSELLKENLYEFGRYIRENGLEPFYTLARLKRIAKQVLSALAYIHSLNLIHCDVKPENIVIKSFSRCEVKLIDFGSSCFVSDHLTTYIQSRSYRAPEVILGHTYDGRIDLWSLGAVLGELLTNYVLFQNDSLQCMLARIGGICGGYSESWLKDCKEASKYFTSTGIVYEAVDGYRLLFPKHTSLAARLHLPATPSASEAGFLSFITDLLEIDSNKRCTAKQALQHPWLQGDDEVEGYVIGAPVAAAEDDEEEDEEDDDFFGMEDGIYEGDEGDDASSHSSRQSSHTHSSHGSSSRSRSSEEARSEDNGEEGYRALDDDVLEEMVKELQDAVIQDKLDEMVEEVEHADQEEDHEEPEQAQEQAEEEEVSVDRVDTSMLVGARTPGSPIDEEADHLPMEQQEEAPAGDELDRLDQVE